MHISSERRPIQRTPRIKGYAAATPSINCLQATRLAMDRHAAMERRTIRTLAVTEATLLRQRCCDHVATEGLGHAATCVHSPQDSLTHLQCAVRATLCSSITSCDHLNRCCTLSLHALAQCSYTQPPLQNEGRRPRTVCGARMSTCPTPQQSQSEHKSRCSRVDAAPAVLSGRHQHIPQPQYDTTTTNHAVPQTADQQPQQGQQHPTSAYRPKTSAAL